MQESWIGLVGVGIGSAVTLVASVIVPWIREAVERRRNERAQERLELRTSLLQAEAALLEYRQQRSGPEAAPALAKFGAALNELTVRLTEEEQPILDVLLMILAMIQEPRPGIQSMVGESMQVLNLWFRGDVPTSRVITEVERRAGVTFSEDRTSVGPVRWP